MPANVLALSGVVFLACALGAAGAWAQGASVDRGNGFVEHGVAAPVSRARGIAAALDGKGRPVVLAWLADHRGCYEMLVVDAATGNSAEYPLPFDTWDSPFAVLLSSGNKFYSLFGNRFVEFDPAARAFTFVGEADDRVAMSMAETPDGTVWAATYPNSHLFSFDPKSRKLVRYGSINHEKWPQYQRHMAIDRSGWVYVGIGNVRSHLIAFNPKTREVRPIAKDDERQPGTGVVWLGTDGKVYGRPGGKASWYVLFEGRATPIEKPPVAAAPTKSGSQETVIRDFPNAWRIHAIDIPDKHMEIFDTKSRDLKRLSFDYSSEGSHIMSLILGPEGKVHGSTGHPLRFFSYDPERDSFTYPGLQDLNGHLNALAVQRGHIFGALYGGGILYEYDPARPWDDMAKKAPNPRRVAAGSKVIGRPHALIAHPDGRTLIMTGTPGYGLTGGGMLIYDMVDGKSEMLDHNRIITNQATISLLALPDGNLVGGTTIRPGTGGATLAKEAELYIMDFAGREVIWHEPIIPGAASINDVVLGPDGLVYGLAAGPTFFVFDPAARRLLHQEKITGYGNLAGGQAPRIMLVGPDGKIYAYFAQAIVRIHPGSFKHEPLAKPPVTINVGIVLRQGRLYFTHGSRLWSWRVPGLE